MVACLIALSFNEGNTSLPGRVNHKITKRDKLMLEKILPGQVDNAFNGHRLSLVFFYFITLITICRSCVHIFAGDGGAQSIATIPLDAFTQGGAEGVIFLFAQWGIAQLMIGVMYLIVALRYRRLVPLMYIFIFFEWGSRIILAFFKSIETVSVAPAALVQPILVLVVPVMFYLSIRQIKTTNNNGG